NRAGKNAQPSTTLLGAHIPRYRAMETTARTASLALRHSRLVHSRERPGAEGLRSARSRCIHQFPPTRAQRTLSSRYDGRHHRLVSPHGSALPPCYLVLRFHRLASPYQLAVQLSVPRPSHSLEIKVFPGDETTAGPCIRITDQRYGLVDRFHIGHRCWPRNNHSRPRLTNHVVYVTYAATGNHRQSSRQVFTDLGG